MPQAHQPARLIGSQRGQDLRASSWLFSCPVEEVGSIFYLWVPTKPSLWGGSSDKKQV